MEQMDLFNEQAETEDLVIPKEVISPLESNRGLKTKKFRDEQLEFSKYVRAIQAFHGGSWFEARKLFFEHRGNQKPIKIHYGGVAK